MTDDDKDLDGYEPPPDITGLPLTRLIAGLDGPEKRLARIIAAKARALAERRWSNHFARIIRRQRTYLRKLAKQHPGVRADATAMLDRISAEWTRS